MAATAFSPSRRVLHSWKEISVYTGRGVRTIQRYETQFGFPIHRPAGSPRSAVLAFSDEIDGWLAGTPKRFGQGTNDNRVPQSDRVLRMHSVFLQAKLGCERAQSVCARLAATRALIEQLCDSMQRSRARRTELVSQIAVAKQQLNSPPPPRAFLGRSLNTEPNRSSLRN